MAMQLQCPVCGEDVDGSSSDYCAACGEPLDGDGEVI